MALFVFAALLWIFSARKWFTGSNRTIEDFDTYSGEYDEKE